MFGDMVFVDHVLGLNEVANQRMPRAQVIDRILNEDLKDELLDYLPVRYDKEKWGTGRLGRVGAYGLKARIALNWGFYEEAAKYADKALKLADGVYDLEPFDVTYCGKDHSEGEPSVSNIFGTKGRNCDEMIWALQYDQTISSNQHNGGYYAAPRIAGGCSYFGPTQNLIDAFQCTDGKSITESDLYDWENPWKNRDPRLDLYCVRPGSRVLGLEFQTAKSKTKIYDYTNKKEVANIEASGSKSEYGANGSKGPAGYLWRKYIDMDEMTYNGGSFSTSSKCVLTHRSASGRTLSDPRRSEHRDGRRRPRAGESRHRDHPFACKDARTHGFRPSRTAQGAALRAHGGTLQRGFSGWVRHPPLEDRGNSCQRYDVRAVGRQRRSDVERKAVVRCQLASPITAAARHSMEKRPISANPRNELQSAERLSVADSQRRVHRQHRDRTESLLLTDDEYENEPDNPYDFPAPLRSTPLRGMLEERGRRQRRHSRGLRHLRLCDRQQRRSDSGRGRKRRLHLCADRCAGLYKLTRNTLAYYVYYSIPAGYEVNIGKTSDMPEFYTRLGAGTARYDFQLKPLAAPEKEFRLVCIGDPQVNDAGNVSRFNNETVADMKSYLADATVPCYAIALGDLVNNKWNLFPNMFSAMQKSKTSLPVFQTIGNHDHDFNAKTDFLAQRTYEALFGPVNYSSTGVTYTLSRWTTSSTAAGKATTTKPDSSNGSTSGCNRI